MTVDDVHEPFLEVRQQTNAYRAGMWIFLASEVMLFGSLFVAYVVCRSTYPDAFAVAGAETAKTLETVNTFILLTSGLTMAIAVRLPRPTKLLVLTAALGGLFIVLKGSEWAMDIHRGLLPGSAFHWTKVGAAPYEAEMFYFLYFVMTGLHMLHLSIAVAAALILAYLTSRGRRLAQEIELGGLYWGFVDIVWMFLFPMFYLIPRR